MMCAKLVEGCPDCERESEFLESVGHECGEVFGPLLTVCEVIGTARRKSAEFHQLSHEPEKCDDCGSVLDDRRGTVREVRRHCASGRCIEFLCPDCGVVTASAGPMDCAACGARPRRLRRLRRLYRSRRR